MAIASYETFIETVSQPGHTTSFTVVAGTSRKLVILAPCAIAQDGDILTFDGNSMTRAVNGMNSGAGSNRNQVWWYDIPDGMSTGSKTVYYEVTGYSNANVTLDMWQLNGRATGAPEYAAVAEASNSVTAVTDSAVSASAGADIVAAVACTSATPTFTWSGGTVTERLENNESGHTTCSADAENVTAGTKTVTATGSSTAGFKLLAVVSVAASSGGLTITSVTPTDVYSQQVDVVVAGTKLSNSATVTFAGTACTGLSASGSTSLKITMPNFYTNNIKVGTVKELKIIG